MESTLQIKLQIFHKGPKGYNGTRERLGGKLPEGWSPGYDDVLCDDPAVNTFPTADHSIFFSAEMVLAFFVYSPVCFGGWRFFFSPGEGA